MSLSFNGLPNVNGAAAKKEGYLRTEFLIDRMRREAQGVKGLDVQVSAKSGEGALSALNGKPEGSVLFYCSRQNPNGFRIAVKTEEGTAHFREPVHVRDGKYHYSGKTYSTLAALTASLQPSGLDFAPAKEHHARIPDFKRTPYLLKGNNFRGNSVFQKSLALFEKDFSPVKEKIPRFMNLVRSADFKNPVTALRLERLYWKFMKSVQPTSDKERLTALMREKYTKLKLKGQVVRLLRGVEQQKTLVSRPKEGTTDAVVMLRSKASKEGLVLKVTDQPAGDTLATRFLAWLGVRVPEMTVLSPSSGTHKMVAETLPDLTVKSAAVLAMELVEGESLQSIFQNPAKAIKLVENPEFWRQLGHMFAADSLIGNNDRFFPRFNPENIIVTGGVDGKIVLTGIDQQFNSPELLGKVFNDHYDVNDNDIFTRQIKGLLKPDGLFSECAKTAVKRIIDELFSSFGLRDLVYDNPVYLSAFDQGMKDCLAIMRQLPESDVDGLVSYSHVKTLPNWTEDNPSQLCCRESFDTIKARLAWVKRLPSTSL